MATLTDKHKTFIVQELACFQTYSEVAAGVKELFGIEIDRQQVYSYDPTKNKIAKKWQEIFHATREKFLDDISSIAIANRSYRLRELDKIYQNQKSAKQQNTKAMKDTLEQAAKEAGDAYTNRQKVEHTGKNGGPVQTVALTLDDWKRQADERLKQAGDTLEKFDA